MTVSNRAKFSCEVLEIATLAAHFTFDNGSFLIDSGPNSFKQQHNRHCLFHLVDILKQSLLMVQVLLIFK